MGMESTAPILRAVPDEHGEVIEVVTREVLEARVVQVEDENRQHVKTIRSQSYELGKLRRDHQADAEDSPYWPFATRMFAWHQKMCNHPGAEWGWERFELALRFLKSRKHGPEACLRAIKGRSLDS